MGASSSMALVVHPRFRHTLKEPPLLCQPATLQTLPSELLELVFAQLDCAKSLCAVQLVSKECRRVALEDLLWRPLCQRHFNVPDYAAPESWRELYRFNVEVFRDLFIKDSESMNRLAGPVELPMHALHF